MIKAYLICWKLKNVKDSLFRDFLLFLGQHIYAIHYAKQKYGQN